MNQINKSEKLNVNISVNVFSYEREINEFGYRKDEVYPIRITKNKGRTHVNLLLLVSNEGVEHYCLIKNMSRLLYTLTKSKTPSFYCNIGSNKSIFWMR